MAHHTHSHGYGSCCGIRLHAEGVEAEHLLHAEQVRSSWLAQAMAQAEEEDRASGVWELATDKWEAGDMVQIEGLRSRADLNGAAGVLIKWVAAVSRWAVTVVATDEKVKVRPDNLRRLASRGLINAGADASGEGTATAEAAGGSGARKPKTFPGTAEAHEMAAQLVAERHLVIDGFLEREGATAVLALLRELREKGELQPGDVAGGRAAAAYARITGQAAPRGDLMRFLEPAEAMEHAPLQALLEAMDAQMAALEAAPALAEEARLTPNRLPPPPPSSSPLLPPPRALQPPRRAPRPCPDGGLRAAVSRGGAAHLLPGRRRSVRPARRQQRHRRRGEAATRRAARHGHLLPQPGLARGRRRRAALACRWRRRRCSWLRRREPGGRQPGGQPARVLLERRARAARGGVGVRRPLRRLRLVPRHEGFEGLVVRARGVILYRGQINL